MNVKTVNFLTQLKNASLINKESIKGELNSFILQVLKALYKEGIILSFKVVNKPMFFNNTSEVLVNVRYINQKPIFANLKIVSSSSYQKIVSLKNICKLITKNKTFLFSTNKGLLSITECKKYHVGGVLLFSC